MSFSVVAGIVLMVAGAAVAADLRGAGTRVIALTDRITASAIPSGARGMPHPYQKIRRVGFGGTMIAFGLLLLIF